MLGSLFGKTLGHRASIASGLLGLGLAVAIVGGNLYYAATCEQVIYQSLPAPDNRKDAVVFAMVCKGDDAPDLQVKIAPVKGFLAFQSPAPFLQLAGLTAEQAAVKLRWLDAQTLQVAMAPQAKIYKQEHESADVKVLYE